MTWRRGETIRPDAQVIGCGCPPCVADRTRLEAGELHAIRADYRIYGIARRGGVKAVVNDHGHHSWIFLPGWMQPILAMDGLGAGEEFLVQATRRMLDDEGFRDTVLATYRLGGEVAVEQLLRGKL